MIIIKDDISSYLSNKHINFFKKGYFLPFTNNELILIYTHLILTIGIFVLLINSLKSFLLLILFFQIFILIFAYYKRFFIKVNTQLSFDKNLLIIQDILAKQKKIHVSIEKEGLYMFELPNKKDTETLVVLCENDNIYLNSFQMMKFYSFRSENLNNLKKLISIKTASIKG